MATDDQTKIRISEVDFLEFQMVENMDWETGVSLRELVKWINEVAERFQPESDDRDARSSQNFTERSFRHYQTLGCIDAPKRVGRSAHYGFRQYLQALLVRKLLWERMSAEQISKSMTGKSNEDYKRMLFEDIDVLPVLSQGTEPVQNQTKLASQWTRHSVTDGIELHIESQVGAISGSEKKRILSEIERLIDQS